MGRTVDVDSWEAVDLSQPLPQEQRWIKDVLEGCGYTGFDLPTPTPSPSIRNIRAARVVGLTFEKQNKVWLRPLGVIVVRGGVHTPYMADVPTSLNVCVVMVYWHAWVNTNARTVKLVVTGYGRSTSNYGNDPDNPSGPAKAGHPTVTKEQVFHANVGIDIASNDSRRQGFASFHLAPGYYQVLESIKFDWAPPPGLSGS